MLHLWEIIGTKLGSLDGLDIGAFNGTELISLECSTDGTTYGKFDGFCVRCLTCISRCN